MPKKTLDIDDMARDALRQRCIAKLSFCENTTGKLMSHTVQASFDLYELGKTIDSMILAIHGLDGTSGGFRNIESLSLDITIK